MNFQDIHVRYGNKPVLNGVSFSLKPGALTAMIGRNGCGKSTLVGCVGGTVPYTGLITEGGLPLAGITRRERARLVAILPQVLLSPHVTVEELVGYGRNPYLPFGARFSDNDRQAVEWAAEITEVKPLWEKYVDRLSGGERQKVYLAMILAQTTPLLLLDEPSTYMDPGYEYGFMQMLSRLAHEEGKTVLVVTHDLTQAFTVADQIVAMEDGKVIFCGSPERCAAEGVTERLFRLKTHFVMEDGARNTYFSQV